MVTVIQPGKGRSKALVQVPLSLLKVRMGAEGSRGKLKIKQIPLRVNHMRLG